MKESRSGSSVNSLLFFFFDSIKVDLCDFFICSSHLRNYKLAVCFTPYVILIKLNK